MRRVVAAETLDRLPAADPAAMRSRRDLRRVHLAMGTRRIVAGGLNGLLLLGRSAAPLRMLELGAGDGSLMLGVAAALAPVWPAVALTLLDRQPLVEHATLEGYAALGWTARVNVSDVLDWAAAPADALLADSGAARWDLIVANLFMHHFEGAELGSLLAAIAVRGNGFLACEPRRGWLPLAGSHLIGVLGANAVTRQDAVLSVHAGFSGDELSRLWPGRSADWQLREGPAGAFSHCFSALRQESG